VTGDQAREHAHRTRAEVDVLLVGTGTVLTDDPALSARPAGVERPHQPLRVVMGKRPTPGARVWRDTNAVAAPTHSPSEVLDMLRDRDIRTLVVEGGGSVLTAFLGAGLVDEVHVYIAPALLGTGIAAVNDLGIATMADALRGGDVSVTALGADCLITAHMTKGK